MCQAMCGASRATPKLADESNLMIHRTKINNKEIKITRNQRLNYATKMYITLAIL